MIRFFNLCLFCISTVSLWGQMVSIEGIIKDQDGVAISYTNIVSVADRKGCVSDDKGYFSIEVMEGDSLKFSHIAFQSKIIPVSAAPSSLSVILDAHISTLEEITILGNTALSLEGKKTRVGFFNYRGYSSYRLGPGHQLAVHIENTKQIRGLIKKINVKIKNRGKWSGEMRVRLLSCTPREQRPGVDLIQDQLIFPIQKIKKRLRIDVSDYQIRFPKEGVFVVVEWLSTRDLETKEPSFFSIAATLKHPKHCVWLSYMDKKWRKMPRLSNHCSTPKLGLEILY